VWSNLRICAYWAYKYRTNLVNSKFLAAPIQFPFVSDEFLGQHIMLASRQSYDDIDEDDTHRRHLRLHLHSIFKRRRVDFEKHLFSRLLTWNTTLARNLFSSDDHIWLRSHPERSLRRIWIRKAKRGRYLYFIFLYSFLHQNQNMFVTVEMDETNKQKKIKRF
jgi:hypothetical protein